MMVLMMKYQQMMVPMMKVTTDDGTDDEVPTDDGTDEEVPTDDGTDDGTAHGLLVGGTSLAESSLFSNSVVLTSLLLGETDLEELEAKYFRISIL